jgi:hypothetical protein
VLATVSPGLRTGSLCRPEARHFCAKANFAALFVLQAGLALATMGLVYVLAVRLSGSPPVGLLTMALTFLMTEPGEQAGFVKVDTLLSFLTVATLTLTVLAAQSGKTAIAAASGATAGLTAVVEPLLAVVAVTSACGLFAVGWRSGKLGACIRAAGCAGAAILVAATVVGFAVRSGYDPEALGHHLARHIAERVAFAALTPPEALAAALLPIPAVGDALALVLPSDQLRRLGTHGLYAPGSAAYSGAMELLPAALTKAGSGWSAAVELAASASRDTIGYLMSMPHIIARGTLGGVGLLGLWGLCHVWRAGRYLHVDGRLGSYAIVAAGTAGCLLTNACLSANVPAANPLIPVLFAVALASVARSV